MLLQPYNVKGSVAGRPRKRATNRHHYSTSRALSVNCSRWLSGAVRQTLQVNEFYIVLVEIFDNPAAYKTPLGQ